VGGGQARWHWLARSPWPGLAGRLVHPLGTVRRAGRALGARLAVCGKAVAPDFAWPSDAAPKAAWEVGGARNSSAPDLRDFPSRIPAVRDHLPLTLYSDSVLIEEF
jgi:hypothetical protein